jgi:hypothetical protein
MDEKPLKGDFRKLRKGTEEALNETLSKEQKSQEQQLKLWKDRPRLAKDEIPESFSDIAEATRHMRR